MTTQGFTVLYVILLVLSMFCLLVETFRPRMRNGPTVGINFGWLGVALFVLVFLIIYCRVLF